MGPIENIKRLKLPIWWGYFLAIFAVAVATWLKYLAQPVIIPADVPILYFLAIIPTAIFFGFGPAILSCLLSIIAYDYFFIPPLYTFGSSQVQSVPILFIFLLVGITVSFLAAKLRQERDLAVEEVTIRKKAEADLLSHREHLEELVKDRTIEVQNVNLILSAELTERKKAEERAQQIAQQWQDTFDAIPDMISIHDGDYNIVRANMAFRKAVGLTPEQLAGKKCYEVFHKTTKPILACPHRQTIETGQATSEEIFETTQNAYFDISTAPIFDADGQVTSAVHIARDVTERKKAEEELRIKDSAIASSIAGIAITDLDGKIAYANRALLEIIGFDEAEILGKPPDLLVSDGTIVAEAMETVRDTGSWQGEVKVNRKDGSIVDVFAMLNAVTDAGGKPICLMASIMDITERKKAERIKDEFIGFVSHELRTPLTVIIGSLRTAMSEGLSQEDLHELVQNAAEGADSLHAILENMLELARHQAGRLQLHLQPVSIANVARVVIEKLKTQGARHEFLVDIPGGLPPVAADSVRVERILYNLLENATKYSPKDREITVSSRVEGDFVVTGVTDRGSGLSTEDRLKLFQLFQRLDASSLAKGAGLGLVVCQRLVEAQGGWIKADSNLGKGSTFSFALPKHRTTQ